MLGKLMPCGGGPPIPLLKAKLLVGRHRSCDIPLGFPTVSGRHCELELLDGYWFVRDLGSSNGTRVNGTLTQANWLLPNDVLAVAMYRYTMVYTPPSGRPPPAAMGTPVGRKDRPAPEAGSTPARAEKPAAGPALNPAPRSSGSALGKLVPCGGGQPIPLRTPRLLLGRHEDCDVVLRFVGVSGHHCLLEWTNGAWFVRDLDSRNGIRVDGVRCSTQRLSPGSVLWVGGLRYEIAYPGSGTAPQPQPKGPQFGQSLLEKAGLSGKLPEPAPEDDQRSRYSLDDAD